MSALVLIWWYDPEFAFPIHAAVRAQILAIDCDAHAADLDSRPPHGWRSS